MALVIKDRVKETTTTTGTGTYTLAGAEVGFQSFSTIGNGNTTYYTVTNGGDWEVGIGTYTASGTTLARTTILSSSNSDNAVDWSVGEKFVFVTQPSSKASFLDASGNLPFPDDDKVTFGDGSNTPPNVTSNLEIYHDGSDSYIQENSMGSTLILSCSNIQIGDAYDDYYITAGYGGVALYAGAFPVFDVASNGINIYGRIYVTGTVDGRDVATDGTKLDGIEAGATADQTTITVSTAGSNVYKFTGDGFPVESGDNPNMYFDRGQTYVINNSQHASHPLDIRLSDGGAAYTSGVSGASGAKVTFTVPMDAPDKLVYQCTSHSAMVGNIYITGKGINGYAVEVVSSLPSSPDSNTIYFVTG